MHSLRPYAFLFCLILISAPAHASKVLKLSKSGKFVVVSHRLSLPWRKKEKVCLFRGTSEIACGMIMKAGKKVAVMKLIKENEQPAVGDAVRRYAFKSWIAKKAAQNAPAPSLTELDAKIAATTPKSAPPVRTVVQEKVVAEAPKPKAPEPKLEVPDALASLDAPLPESKPEPRQPQLEPEITAPPVTASVVNKKAKRGKRQVAAAETLSTSYGGRRQYGLAMTLGGSVGLNHLFPSFGLQYHLNERVGLGASAFVVTSKNGTTTLSATGFYVSGHFYFGKTKYQGLWLQAGLGGVGFSVTRGATAESAFRLAVLGTAGWRFHFSKSITLGAALGGQFIGDPKSSLITVGFKNFQPTATLDLGILF